MKIFPSILLFWLYSLHAYSQNAVSCYEYWFNDNYAGKSRTEVSPPQTNYTLNLDISAAALQGGINRFSIRFLSENGLWSPVINNFFENRIDLLPVKLSKFEYWFNFNYGSKTTVPLPAEADFTITDAIPSSSLPDGINVITYRIQDDLGRWSAAFSQPVYKVPQTPVDGKIARYEYWFDNPASKTTVEITPVADFVLMDDIPALALSEGMHILYFRTQDENRLWSPVIGKIFSKIDPLPAENHIVRYEYWFDFSTSRISVDVSPGQKDFVLTGDIPAGGLGNGIHSLSFRTQDEKGLWSPLITRLFTRVSPPPAAKNIIGYEYWFDMDHSARTFVAETPAQYISLNTDIPVLSFSEGPHSFHIRFLDSEGNWSFVLTSYFIKINPPADNVITGYRYWVDGITAGMQYVDLAVPVKNFHTVVDINAIGLTLGNHTLSVQYCDINRKWSVVHTATFYKAYPVAGFTNDAVPACDTLTVQFTNNSQESDSWLWDFGDGNTSNEQNPAHTFTSGGNYTISLTATDITSGNYSVATVIIPVASSTSSLLTVAACDSYTAPDGQVYTTSGIRTAVIPNTAGCDSTITINLTVNQSSNSSIALSACDSYTAPDGQVYTASGIITAVIPNTAGCDSTITIDLSILQSTASSITVTVCDSYTAPDGQVYTTSGIKTAVIPNIAGCDSIITIDLTVKYSSVNSFPVTVCEVYTAPDGLVYSTSGIVTAVIPNAAGCDSIITINLTVNENSENSVTAVACDSYTAPDGQVYTSSGIITAIIPNSAGCDSSITIDLTVHYSSASVIYPLACEVYTAPDGMVYSASGVYSAVIPNTEGCDSTVTINLTIGLPQDSTIDIIECDTFTAPDGQVYYQSGIYTAIIPTVAGCDSTITINLEVRQSTDSAFAVTACDSYTAPDGQEYSGSGIITAVIPNISGCDSTITIDLTILSPTSSEISEEECFDYTAPDGQQYTATGQYIAVIPNVAGCDSTITINLTINTVDVSVTNNDPVLEANASGAEYAWVDCNNGFAVVDSGSQIFTATENGSYAVIVTQNGCTDTSNCYQITSVGMINLVMQNGISIYPNPSSFWFYIDIGGFNYADILVKDVTGKNIIVFSAKSGITRFGSGLLPGIYYVTVKAGESLSNFSLIRY